MVRIEQSSGKYMSQTKLNRIRKIFMAKSKRIMVPVFFLFMLSSLWPQIVNAQELEASPALQTLLNQCEQGYLKMMNSNLDYALNNRPFALAGLLGLTMRRQLKYSALNPQFKDQFDELNRQCLMFLKGLARIHNYQSPKDGSPLSDRMLIEKYSIETLGKSDAFMQERYGIDPLTINLPMMLNQVSLLGVKASGSESDTDYTPSKDGVVEEDFLLGTWVDPKNRNNQITFQRQGGRYVASLIQQFTDKGKPYSMTTVYTVLSSQINNGILGKVRVWNVHRKHICTPKANVWNCTNGSEKTYRISLRPPMNGKPYYSIAGDFIEIDDWIKL